MKKFTNSESIKKIARVLLIVGGLNRGLLGLFNVDIVALIFGYGFVTRVVYTLVGLSAVYLILYSPTKTHTPLRK